MARSWLLCAVKPAKGLASRSFGFVCADQMQRRTQVIFPQRLTRKQCDVIERILGKERTALLSGLLRLHSAPQQVLIGEEEALHCDQCWYDTYGSPEWCMPASRFWSWWGAAEPLDPYHGGHGGPTTLRGIYTSPAMGSTRLQ